MAIFIISIMSAEIDTVNTALRAVNCSSYCCILSSSTGLNPLTAAPSRSPGNVTARAIGNNQVRITWTPPANVSGYLLLYTTNTSTDVNSVDIEDPTAVEYIFDNLSVEARYTISLVAYATLPSEQSQSVNFELRCKWLLVSCDASH